MIYNVEEYEQNLKDKEDADKEVSSIRDGAGDTKLRENTSMELYTKSYNN